PPPPRPVTHRVARQNHLHPSIQHPTHLLIMAGQLSPDQSLSPLTDPVPLRLPRPQAAAVIG
ncbi:hypothetical protein P8631_13775, partial [Guyparkeria sp. 1SP6A2]|nr:hypothetical protein [Guyparkeria sp. 1SP6A2]